MMKMNKTLPILLKMKSKMKKKHSLLDERVTIPLLQKLSGFQHPKPLWLLIQNGEIVSELSGANPPKMLRVIRHTLDPADPDFQEEKKFEQKWPGQSPVAMSEEKKWPSQTPKDEHQEEHKKHSAEEIKPLNFEELHDEVAVVYKFEISAELTEINDFVKENDLTLSFGSHELPISRSKSSSLKGFSSVLLLDPPELDQAPLPIILSVRDTKNQDALTLDYKQLAEKPQQLSFSLKGCDTPINVKFGAKKCRKTYQNILLPFCC